MGSGELLGGAAAPLLWGLVTALAQTAKWELGLTQAHRGLWRAA